VAHHLVLEAEGVPAAGLTALVDHEHVRVVRSLTKPGGSERGDFIFEAEGPRRRNLALVRLRRNVERCDLRLNARSAVVVEDERDAQSIRRNQVDPPITVLDVDRLRQPQPATRYRLSRDPSVDDRVNEGAGTAVANRRLRRVDLDESVVDADARQRGHDVFDGLNAGFARPHPCASAQVAD